MWKIVEERRKLLLSKDSEPECQDTNTLLTENLIQENSNYIESKIILNQNTTVQNVTIPTGIFKSAAEIFTYLNYCPPKLYFFMKGLLKTDSPTSIILALTSIIKSSRNAAKESSIEIFLKAMNDFKLNTYEDIESLVNGANDQKNFSMLSKLIESEEITSITNHPVHVRSTKGKLLPTALIPFCEFGGNLSIMGMKLKYFDSPFCNSFRERFVRNQLCYEVDPNKYKPFLNENAELGLTLFINYNEDRQMSPSKDLNISSKEYSLVENKFLIVDTIGKPNL